MLFLFYNPTAEEINDYTTFGKTFLPNPLEIFQLTPSYTRRFISS